MAARPKQSFKDRVEDYVDSPLMRQRMRFGKNVSAQIAGNYGAYRTQVMQAKKLTGECTCPSEIWPCKHVHALRKTWEVNPNSFFDLDGLIKKLADGPKESLLETISNMVAAEPRLQCVFGIPGFEDEEVDDEYFE